MMPDLFFLRQVVQGCEQPVVLFSCPDRDADAVWQSESF